MGEFSSRMRRAWGHPDAILAFVVVGLIILLIIPLPAFLLDALLCLSIVFSVMALLLTLYVENALEFSSFPSLLLFLTLFRLGLNIASTRMILTRGEGGDIIRTFGDFVIKGNIAVGLILFALLTIINFIVVTKGAGRIAEVAARFTLEALPGKQLAIDGELSAGLITQDEAKKTREKISQEADFYGAMDGASKFVRGDAIAGIVITCVNIIGGLVIGLFMKEMSWQRCVTTFTRLTVGDGLVSQIPALFVSVAAGIMVTRVSSGSLSKTLTKQVFHHPKVLLIAGITVLALSFLPGMPFLVMLPISSIFGIFSYVQFKGKEKTEPQKQEGSSSTLSLFVHPIEVELGYQVVIFADPLLQRLTDIRKKVASHLGVRVPQVQITDRMELAPTAWRIRVRGVTVSTGRDAELSSLIKTLTDVIEEHAHALLTRQDVAQMLKEVKSLDSAVVDELIGKKLTAGQVLKILQNLLRERIPIRDFVTILEILADNAKGEASDLEELTELVRVGLSRGISEEFFGKSRLAHVITIDPKVEQILDVSKGKVRPATVDKLARTLLELSQQASSKGLRPVVVTEVATRSKLKKLIEKQLPDLPVLSYKEVAEDIELYQIGTVTNEVLI